MWLNIKNKNILNLEWKVILLLIWNFINIITFIFSGYYECLCPKYYTGIHCEYRDLAVTAGIGKPTKATPTQPAVSDECIKLGCETKVGNGECDVSLLSFK